VVNAVWRVVQIILECMDFKDCKLLSYLPHAILSYINIYDVV